MNKKVLRESIINEIHFTFARAGGNGGQNVNKVNTKVYATISINALKGLTNQELSLVISRLSNNINKDNELYISVDEERTQERNRIIALNRLEQKIIIAAQIPKVRHKTTPTKNSQEKRLKGKKLHSSIKKSRNIKINDEY